MADTSKGQGHTPNIKDTSPHNYFRFVWDDDEEADDVPTPPLHRKDYPEPPALPPDIIPPTEVHSGNSQKTPIYVPRLEAPPSHPNPHRSPTRPNATTTTPTNINKNIYNLSTGEGSNNGSRLKDNNRVSGSHAQGEVVLGIKATDALYSSTTNNKDNLPETEDTHPQVSYPALEGLDGGDKAAGGSSVPILQYPGMRPRGSYESSGVKRPLSPLRVNPKSKVAEVENTHVSLLSDDENILATDDADMTSPFTPDHGNIMAPPGGSTVNKQKKRRMIIWAIIMCASMVIAGLVTYLIIRAVRGW